jgi:hypothetical protein
MQKHIKARKIRAPKIHTKSTNVSSLLLMMSTFRFLPVFRLSYNMILNFKTRSGCWWHAELAMETYARFEKSIALVALLFNVLVTPSPKNCRLT